MNGGTESEDRFEERRRQIRWVAGFRTIKDKSVRPGSFYEHLIRAFFAADRKNFARLSEAFPTTAKAYQSYMKGE